MATWALHDAKARFSELVDRALTEVWIGVQKGL